MYKLLGVSVFGLCSLLRTAAAFPAAKLHEVQSIELPAVSGPIDHMAADVAGAKLFVAAAEDHSVEAVDLKAGRVVTRVTGLKQPQRVALIPPTAEIRRRALLSSTSGIPEGQELIVTNRGDLHADIYDGLTFLPIKQIEVEQNQGDIQFDARVGRAYIGGESGGEPVLAVIDESYVKVQEILLSGRPASFQLESKGNRIFVNLPTMGTVAVVDRMQGRVVASWRLAARGNFAMALDEAHHRLFISARDPAKLLVLDTQTGRTIASLDCVGDAEDIFYAADRGLIYVSGGEGFIDVFHQVSQDNYELVEKVPTAKHARTSLYVPQWHRLFVAIPSREGVQPQIRVYQAD
jgi:DNA-binding beta-propeller fold protein YncE